MQLGVVFGNKKAQTASILAVTGIILIALMVGSTVLPVANALHPPDTIARVEYANNCTTDPLGFDPYVCDATLPGFSLDQTLVNTALAPDSAIGTATGGTVVASDPLIKFRDAVVDNVWLAGPGQTGGGQTGSAECVFRDNNNNNIFESTLDTVIFAGSGAGACTGTAAIKSDPKIKFLDTTPFNGLRDPTERVFYDFNNNNVMELGTIVFFTDIVLHNAVNVFAWQVLVRYDPTKFNVRLFNIGQIWTDAGGSGFPSIDNVAGTAGFGATLTATTSAVSHPGPISLVRINWRVMNEGASNIHLVTDVEDVSFGIQLLDAETPARNILYDSEDGFVSTNLAISPLPNPEFTFSPANPVPRGTTVNFDASASLDVDTFDWNFGDGTTGLGPIVSKAYPVACDPSPRPRPINSVGCYRVFLRGSNPVGAAVSTKIIIVRELAQPLVVTVTCPDTGLTAGKPFTCDVSATGGTPPYTGTGPQSAVFPVKGGYTVSFTVTDSAGNSASGSDTVVIAPQPLVVTVDCPNTGLTAGKPFICNVSAAGGTTPYTGTGPRTVTQPVKGTFTQTFSVTDANAVTASGSDTVVIAAQPLVVTVDCPNTGLTAGKPFNCNVSATGGTSPYTGTGVRSVTQPVKGTFTQTFSVTDANAVTASGSDSVTIAAQPLAVTVDCPNTGLTAGKPFNCNVSATGGTSPYTGTGARSVTQPVKGTFTVTLSVTDSNGATASGSDPVTIAAQPLVVTVDCPNTGLTAGKPFNCNVTATGGTAPYTGTGSRSATQPTKGSFTQSFSVTDANGVTATGSDPVTIAAQPLVVSVNCPDTGLTAGKPFNCVVSATGGTAPYTGTGTLSVTRPTKGTFTQSFTLTDANAVSATGSDPVTIAAQPLVVTVDCPNTGLTAGKPFNCNVSATGGTSPYTGTGVRSATQPTKGSFSQSFTVTDSNAVSATGSDPVTIAAQPLVVTVDCPNTGLTAGKPFTCNVTATGGTSPYTGTGAMSVTRPTKGTFTQTFSVTDANAVTASGSDSVTIAAQPLVVTVDCPNTGLTAGKPFNCNVSATGGTAPYTGTGVRSATQPVKGTFTQSFSVTDANAVTATGSDPVTIAAQPLVTSFTFSPANPLVGQSVTFTATASGGTGPYTFSWTFGDGGTGTGSPISHSYATKGSKTVTLSTRDANNVLVTSSQTVPVSGNPLVVTVDCPNTGLTAGKPFNCNVTATGGTAPYTGTGSRSATQPTKGSFSQSFSVTDANGATATGSDPVTIAAQPLVVTVDCPNTGLTAGKPFTCNVSATGGTSPYTGTGAISVTRPTKGTFTQSFTVTDSNAVSATGSDPVTIAAQPLVVTVNCPNTGLTAGKPFNCVVSATGGTAPYTGTGTLSVTRPTKGTFTQSFSVTDANAVTASGSDSVTIAAQPLVVTVDCPNTGLTAGKPFTCNVTATGGTAPYTGTGAMSVTRPTKGSFTQTFSVTDANAVTASGSDTVTIAAQPLVVTVDCPNTGLTAGKPFNCNVTATGGTSPYTGTGVRSATQPTKGSFSQSFSVTDANAVTASGSDPVTIGAQPIVVTVDCPNSGLTAGKPFNCTVSATGGTAPYTGTGTRSATQPTKGTFTQTFSVTDANAVTASGSDSVTIAGQPLVVIVDCPNTGLTAGKPFTCNVSATGGTAPYTGTGAMSVTRPTKGTFTQTFSVTDANAVTASGSDSVTIVAQPLVVTVDCPNTGLTAGKPFNCNVSATGGTSPYTGTGVRSATQPTKGTFSQSFSVTDANAVTASGSDPVTIAAQPLVVTVACPNTGLTAGKPFNCTVSATGGTAPYTGTGTRSATQPVKGTFSQSFSVTDANAVTASGSDPVTIAAQPLVVTVDCPNTGLTAGKPFTCNVSATGGTAPYTGTGARSVTQPTKGTFTQTFSVTDANAVTASGSDPVTIAAQPLVVTVDCPNTGLTAGKPFNCNVTATGGTAPYTGTGSRSATQPVKGTFTQSFSVTDANAVTASGSDPVTIAAQPLTTSFTFSPANPLVGQSVTFTATASGGTGPYTFSWTFGDGGTGTGSPVSHTYATKGSKTVTLSTRDANNVLVTSTQNVPVSGQTLVVTVDCPNTGLTAGKPFNCNVSATGGTAPYTGTGSRSVTQPTKGTFTVTLSVTDANGATASGSDPVTIAAQPLVVTVDCPNTGLTAGKPFTCNVSATGGTSPYTGTGAMSVTRPTKGTFTQTFSVTDANAVTASGSDTVVIAAQPLVVTVDCPNTGLTAGKPFNCNVSATGGTSPYTGTGVRSATQPTKGTFSQSFSVTDANAVTASGSDPVTIAAQPLVVTVDCPNTGLTAGKAFNCTVSATGGTAPYTGTGAMSVTRPTKGSFTQSFSVTDANAVTASGSDTVTIGAQPLVVTVDCPNTGLTAGKPFNCNVTATGGTAPYTGTGSRSATQPVKGTFTQTFSVTDANAVTASGSDSVTIAAQPLTTSFTFSPANPLVGQSVTFTATASGGTGPYTFSWTFGDGGTGTGSPVSHTYATKGPKTVTLSTRDANNVLVTSTQNVPVSGQTLVVTVDCPNTGLTAGKPFNCNVSATGGTAPYTGTGTMSVTRPTKGTFTQSFTVTDSNGATATGSDPVTIAAQPLVVTVNCPNSGLTAGKPFICTVSATGGTSPYTGTGNMSVTRPTKGTFTQTFSVTDANAVTASGSDTVVIAGQPVVTDFTFTPANPLVGQSVTFTATASGGTGPYTFSWTFGDGGTGTGSPVSHTYATKGSKTVTLTTTDANNVVVTAVHSVSVGGTPLTVTVDCPNTGLTAGKPFTCNVTATGGTAPYTGTGAMSVTRPTKGTFTQSFSVTDANGSTASGSDSVTIAAQPLVVTVDCPNTGLTAGKSFTCNVTATGGTAPYTGTGTMSVIRPTKGTFTQTFSVTDANGVTASGSDSVNIAPQPLVVIVDCPNSGLTAGKPFNCNVTAGGGTSPYTGTGTMSVIRPTKGTFTQSFTVTDGNGVTATGSDTVVIAAQPLVTDFTFAPANPLVGQSVTFTASASGGTGPYTFSWTFGDGGTGTGSPVSHTYATKGSFTVTLSTTDANNVVVTAVHTVPVGGAALTVTVDCPNTGLTAGKPFNCNVTATGGTSPYTGTGSRSATQPTKGTFTQTFSVTDANGSTASGSDTVLIAGQPLVVTVDCPNTGLTAGKPFNCTVTATGGTAPYTGTGSRPVVQPVKGSFTQSFSVTDSNGATASGSDSVTIAPQALMVTVDCPSTGLTAGKPFNCNVTGTGGTSPYTGTGVRSATQPTKGTFTQSFTITDANGVSVTGSDSVTIAAQPLVVTVDCPNTGLTAGKPFNCNVTATGGTAPYTGTGMRSVTQPTKGTFTVTFSVTDANGATASGSDSVTISAQPLVVTVDCPNAGLTAGKPFNCNVSATGGTAPYTGTGSRSATQPVKGTFSQSFSVTDANGATASGSDSVTIAAQPLTTSFTFSPASPLVGQAVTFTATASGGTGPYTFSWTFGDGGTGTGSPVSHTYATKGSKTVTLSTQDANNVVATSSQNVPVSGTALVVTVDCPNTGLTAGKPFNCTVSATGGTAPYTGTGARSVTQPVKGTFTVTFSVTDANGATASGSDSVTIAMQPLVVTVDCPNTGLTAGKPFNCTVSATGGTAPYTGTGSRSATQPTKGTFTQTFSVTDANGATASGSDSVTIAGQPIVTDFTFTPANPLIGQSVTFTATASGGTGPYTFSWTFGDGGTGTGSPVSHSYSTKGTFTVTLSTRDANNVVATAVHTVPVGGAALIVTVDCPNTGLTAGKPFNCNVTATGGTAPYTGTGSRPVVQPVKGSFTQSFTVTDANGSTATGSDTVIIAPQTGGVTVDCPNSGLTAGKPFNCNVSATGGTAPYTGTGSRSVTFPTKGTFTVTFSVTDANGATASGSDSVTIAPQALVLSVVCPDTGLTAGKPFNCSVTATGGTSPYTGTGMISVTRPTKGTFTQSFTATDANGLSVTASDSVTIAPQPLVVTVDCPNTGLTAGKPFNCNVTATGGTAPYTGTGSRSATQPVKGTFTQSFSVTDANGVSASGSDTVVIGAQPLVTDFTFTPASPLVGQSVAFTATTSGGTGPYTFSWNFGDGSTGTGNPASHTYSSKGSFTITLTTTDANAVTQTASHIVSVSPQALTAGFTFSPASPFVGQTVTFTATVSGGTSPYMFDWSFGDGSTGSGNPVMHSYVAAGSYPVTLTVTDANGATATASRTVVVAGVGEDTDGDGIFDTIDTQPAVFSNDFSDIPLGGMTTGTILSRGDQTLRIMDEPAPGGVRAIANMAGGATPADVSFCSGAAILSLTPGDEVVVTCSSVTVQVISGPVDATFVGTGGAEGTASIPAGNSITFDPTTFTFTAPSTNTATITITVDGQQFTVPPGGTVTVSVPTACFVASAIKKGQVIGVGSPGVKFDGRCSTAAPGLTLVDYAWDFGDGSPVVSGAELKVPTHIYAVNGTYTVSLTVTQRDGLTATESQAIDVKPAPIVDSLNFKRNMKASQSLTQTWTVNLINPNAFPIYAKVEITGTGDTVGAFTVMSGPVLLPVGSGITTITLSKTFTSFDVGLTWNFQVKVTFSGNGIAGTYELGAIQTDFFRIRP